MSSTLALALAATFAGIGDDVLRSVDAGPWRTAAESGSPVLVSVELGSRAPTELRLERFRATSADTRFVVGGRGGDRPLDWDPDSVVLLRGDVRGEAGSSAFVALSPWGNSGIVRTSAGDWAIGGTGDSIVLAPSRAGGSVPGIPWCGVSGPEGPTALVTTAIGPPGSPAAGPRVLEIAIETDYEYFVLHEDLDAAAAYLVQLFGAVSEIYEREVNTRVVVSYARLWDSSDDLFNEENPLQSFRGYWNANMTDVDRDVAQFFSGRRDMPFGGIAYLSALCGPSGYSVVGYALGFSPDESGPSIFQYDVHVAAHELGHNCGALHTHDYGLDSCNELDGTHQRGSIMSYCSQTTSGGNANTDLEFQTVVRGAIDTYLDSIECLHLDCNGNGIDDGTDVASLTSADANANDVPDECEDCNRNGILDDTDIAGPSTDHNSNGLPDECEPDCNGNGFPDDLDIALGDSTDAWSNGVPDECESDCDGDGTSDYTEIQAQMSLDLDRNLVLDACEDCDGDSITDLDELQSAHHAWIASTSGSFVREFHSHTGTLTQVSVPGHVSLSEDLVIDATGRIFVASGPDNRVAQFDRSGAWVGDFVPTGSGGLAHPAALAFGPNGNLFVASNGTDSVLEYDGVTGAFAGVFVAPASGGLDAPQGLAFAPNGNLFVASRTDEVLEYDGTTGSFARALVSEAANGGLSSPRGLLFLPGGTLIVASFATNEILQYSASTGAFLGKFNKGGTENALTLDAPWGLRLGPDGYVYVGRYGVTIGEEGFPWLPDPQLHVNSTRLYVFDPESGNFIRSYVLGHDTGLEHPTGFDFFPGAAFDCNRNGRPDACDLLAGTSTDADFDGVPDECAAQCPADLDGNGNVGFADLTQLLVGWGECPVTIGCRRDLDGSGAVGFNDLTTLLLAWGSCTS